MKICNFYCPGLKFNFNILKSDKVDKTPYNSYSLSGNANLYKLYNLISQIETQQMLMTIEQLKLNPITSTPEVADTVNYLIKFNAYYKEDGTNLEDIPFSVNNHRNLYYNPFTPKIHAPDNSKLIPSLVNIDKARLIAITKNSIFVENENGRVVELSVGDKVNFGYLNKIDKEKEQAIFILNKIGINKRKILEFAKE